MNLKSSMNSKIGQKRDRKWSKQGSRRVCVWGRTLEMPTTKWRWFLACTFWFTTRQHPWSKNSWEADWQRSDSRPVVEGAVAAVVLVGEERALDKDTWLGLETLVTSCVWLVVDDWRLRAPAPWKEVPLLKVLTTSICGRRVEQKTNGCSETQRTNGNIGWLNGWIWWWKHSVSTMTQWGDECLVRKQFLLPQVNLDVILFLSHYLFVMFASIMFFD